MVTFKRNAGRTMLMTQRVVILLVSSLLLWSCATTAPKRDTSALSKDSSGAAQNIEGGEYIEISADVEADFDRAVALLETGDYQEAVPVLESVIQREQRLIAPFVNLGIAYHRSGNTENAIATLKKALAIDEHHPVANNELGLLHRQKGEFDQARESYEKVILVHPDYPAAIRNLGVLCDLYLHDFECALNYYEQYSQLHPDDKDVSIWIADVKSRLDN